MEQIDNRTNYISKVNLCYKLKEYFERVCNKLDNPTFNMLEVEIKRAIATCN